MAERSFVLVYSDGSITASEDSFIYFSDNQICSYVENDISSELLKRIIDKNLEVVATYQISITYFFRSR